MRKIVQIAAGGRFLYALSDDGVVFFYISVDSGWEPLPPLPQPRQRREPIEIIDAERPD